MATDHLQIPDIAASQNQKEVTANAAHNLLDRKINQIVPVTVTAADTFTITETRENCLVELVGTPGDTTIDMPDTNEVYMRILNSTDGVITIRNSAGAGLRQPVIVVGSVAKFHYDGTDFQDTGSGTSTSSVVTAIGTLDLLHVRDEKTDGTAGGGSTGSSFATRTLNTVLTNDINGASLAANRITLAAGTYEIVAEAPARDADTHRLRLQDITGASTLLIGQNADTDTAQAVLVQTTAHLFGRFTLTVQSDVELQHFVGTTRASDGFGLASSDTGSVEVYADVRIRKVSTVVTAPGLPFKGALVKLTSDESLSSGSVLQIPWDTEIYDAGDFFSLGSPSRLTVPNGITRVRLTGQIGILSGLTADRVLVRLRKNANLAVTIQTAQDLDPISGAPSISISTPVFEVVAGDFFELEAFQDSGGALTIDAAGASGEIRSYFSIEAVEAVAPSTLSRGALVHKVADETANYSTRTAIPWDSEVYDTDDIHDNAVNNTRLTVPTGVNRVQFQGTVLVTGATSGEFANLHLSKNGVLTAIGLPTTTVEVTDTTFSMNLSSPVFEVIAGDFFELELEIETDTSITLDNDRSWFSMEIAEPAVVAGGAGLEAEWFDVDLMYPSTTNGAAAPVTTELTAGNPNVRGSVFINATEEHFQFQWKPPKRWDDGTVTFRVYYSHAAGQTGGLDGVAWGLAAVAVGDASNIDVAYGTEVVVIADNAAANQVFITPISAPVTVGGTPDSDKQVYWEISRVVGDAADDFDGAGGMRLHSVEIFWTSDKSTDD